MRGSVTWVEVGRWGLGGLGGEKEGLSHPPSSTHSPFRPHTAPRGSRTEQPKLFLSLAALLFFSFDFLLSLVSPQAVRPHTVTSVYVCVHTSAIILGVDKITLL